VTVQIIRGNALALPLADDSVDLVVTSPPYFGLRSYQDGGAHYEGQIGDEATPAEFVDALIAATAEMVRVVKPSGSIWVNLGDKYASGGGLKAQTFADESAVLTASRKGKRTSRQLGVPEKSLIGIPWRYALRCIDDLGLILRAEVIWSKPNGLPESVTDRVRRSHEQWFHFTLSPRYYSAVDEIREASGPEKACGPGAMRGPRSIRERGTADPTMNNPLGKLPGSVWTIATEPLHVPDHLGIDHFAAYPTEWPRRIIQGWSPRGICVECGEGLVPITTKDGGRPVARAHRHLPGYADPAGEGMRDQSYRIEGYSCACPPSPISIASARTTASTIPTTRATDAAAAAGSPSRIRDATVPTRPGLVLDPFGGTGTTALVAQALGRNAVHVDMSADYCRLATWRTSDPKQQAKAARREYKPPAPQLDGQLDLLEGLGA
jgi:DNA modification methylase